MCSGPVGAVLEACCCCTRDCCCRPRSLATVAYRQASLPLEEMRCLLRRRRPAAALQVRCGLCNYSLFVDALWVGADKLTDKVAAAAGVARREVALLLAGVCRRPVNRPISHIADCPDPLLARGLCRSLSRPGCTPADGLALDLLAPCSAESSPVQVVSANRAVITTASDEHRMR